MTNIIEKLTYINSQIRDIKGQLSVYGVISSAALSSLNFGINTLKNNLDDKAAEAEAVSAEFDTLYGQYVDIGSNYSEISGNYTALETRFNDLSGNYTSLETSFNDLSGEYQAMSSDYASAELLIDSILSA